MTAYTDFLSDPNREDIWLLELYPYDKSTGLPVTTPLRFSDREFATEPSDTPANILYVANSDFAYSFSAPTAVPGTFGILPSQQGGVIELGQKLGDLDYLEENYEWDGRRVVVKHGGTSISGTLSYADYAVVRDCESEQIETHLDKVRIILRDKSERFNHPVESRTLAGLGYGLEFDGATGYVAWGSPAKLDIVNAISLDFWIVPYSLPGNQHVLGWSSAGAIPYRVFLDSSGHVNFSWTKATVTVTKTSTFAMTAGLRYHVGITLSDTTVTMYFYTYSTSTAHDPEVFTGTGFTGRDAGGGAFRYGATFGGASFYHGQLWSVRIRSTTDTRQTIEERRWRPTSSAEEADSSLEQNAKMTDGAGVVVTDHSPSAANGTISGTTNLTTGTIAAAATGNRFTRAAGSFSADGWLVGDVGISSGYATGANNANFTVTAVSATQLDVLGPTLVNEAGTGDEVLARYGVRWRPTLTGILDSEQTSSGEVCQNCFGKVFNVAPQLVWPFTNIYQIHPGYIESVVAVYEGAYPDITLNSTYSDLETFLLGSTPAARYDVLITVDGSYIRLGSQPQLPITVDVEGDAYDTGSGPDYASTIGTIFRRIVTTRGPSPLVDPTDLDTTSFSDLESANSALSGIVVRGDDSIMEVSEKLLKSCGAVAWFARSTGDLTVLQITGATVPTATITLTQDDIEEDLSSIVPVPVELPAWEVIVKYRKNWTVMGTTAIAGDAKGTWRYAFSLTEWRKVRWANDAVKVRHPRARSVVVESCFQTPDGANAEASRQLALYYQKGQSFTVKVRNRALQLDRYDSVYLHYQSFDASDVLTDRLQTSASSQFWVLGVDEDATEGTVTLDLWREVVT